MPSLVSGVTADNYGELASDFVDANGGHGAVIATANGSWQGVGYSQTLRQWGAWVAFFESLKIGHAFMHRRDFYTVPAGWPHEFTSDATIQGDHEAGVDFERRFLAAAKRGIGHAERAQDLIRRTVKAKWARTEVRRPAPDDPFLQ